MDTITLPLQDIKFDFDLERKKKAKPKMTGGLEAIKESIKNIGLKEPLIVYEDNNSYYLCDGYNRVKAILELLSENNLPDNLNINFLESVVISKSMKNVIRYMTDIRQDLPPSLKAKYIRMLADKGMTRKTIAHICGYSTNTIRNWLNVSRVSKPLQDLMDSKKLPIDSAVAISPLNEKGQEHLYRKIKDWRIIRRDEVRNLVASFPDRYYRLPKDKRTKLADKLKSSKKRQSEFEKRFLSKSLHEISIEKEYLDEELRTFRNKTRKLIAWIEKLLRNNEVKDYLVSNHKNIFDNFNEIIRIELGRNEVF